MCVACRLLTASIPRLVSLHSMTWWLNWEPKCGKLAGRFPKTFAGPLDKLPRISRQPGGKRLWIAFHQHIANGFAVFDAVSINSLQSFGDIRKVFAQCLRLLQ